MSKLSSDLSAVTSVGLDLAKHVFQVHAVDAGGRVIVARALRRRDVLPLSVQSVFRLKGAPRHVAA